MGYTLSQTPTGSQNASSASARATTYSSSTTSGNTLIVVGVSNGTGNPTLSISDSNTNSWTQVFLANDTTNNTRVYGWVAPNCVGGASHSVTLTPSAAAFISMGIMETAGGATSSPQDGSGATLVNSNTNAPSTGSVTTSQINDLIFGCLTQNGSPATLTPGANYTQAYENESVTNMPINFQYDLDVDSSQVCDWSMGASRLCAAGAAAIKENTGGGGGRCQSEPCLG
jgi:hypothetical protein